MLDGGWISIVGNLVVDGGGAGVYVNLAYGTIANNTIEGNGRLGYSTAGIALSLSSSTISRNVINANYGAGALVGKDAVHVVISQNSIFDNGTAVVPRRDELNPEISAPPPPTTSTTGPPRWCRPRR